MPLHRCISLGVLFASSFAIVALLAAAAMAWIDQQGAPSSRPALGTACALALIAAVAGWLLARTIRPIPHPRAAHRHGTGTTSPTPVARGSPTSREPDAHLEAERRLEALDKLTGGVAHAMNNLLQVMESGLTVLGCMPGPERRAAVEASMSNAVARGARLTRQLLAFARQQPLAPGRVDLARHLGDGHDLLPPGRRGNIELTVVLPPDLWPVMADRAQLDLALRNLVGNACDAMPSGGRLTLAAENLSLPGDHHAKGLHTEGLRGEFVSLLVTDTGVGMPPEVLSRACEPFFTTKDASRGSGLGLSQVWGFARQSGGAAVVESAPEAGTTVALVLPRAVGPASGDQHGPLPSPPGEGLAMALILLVEDDPDVADMLAEVLQSLGYSVRHAPNGSAALELVTGGLQPDAVITDMMMPGGLSGLALAKELDVRRPGLPVVLATGYSERAAEFRASGLPVLSKPFRAIELETVLRTVLPAGPDQAPT